MGIAKVKRHAQADSHGPVSRPAKKRQSAKKDSLSKSDEPKQAHAKGAGAAGGAAGKLVGVAVQQGMKAAPGIAKSVVQTGSSVVSSLKRLADDFLGLLFGNGAKKATVGPVATGPLSKGTGTKVGGGAGDGEDDENKKSKGSGRLSLLTPPTQSAEPKNILFNP